MDTHRKSPPTEAAAQLHSQFQQSTSAATGQQELHPAKKPRLAMEHGSLHTPYTTAAADRVPPVLPSCDRMQHISNPSADSVTRNQSCDSATSASVITFPDSADHLPRASPAAAAARVASNRSTTSMPLMESPRPVPRRSSTLPFETPKSNFAQPAATSAAFAGVSSSAVGQHVGRADGARPHSPAPLQLDPLSPTHGQITRFSVFQAGSAAASAAEDASMSDLGSMAEKSQTASAVEELGTVSISNDRTDHNDTAPRWDRLPAVVLYIIRNMVGRSSFTALAMHQTCRAWHQALGPIYMPPTWHSRIFIFGARIEYISWAVQCGWVDPAGALTLASRLGNMAYLTALKDKLDNVRQGSQLAGRNIYQELLETVERPFADQKPLPRIIHDFHASAARTALERQKTFEAARQQNARAAELAQGQVFRFRGQPRAIAGVRGAAGAAREQPAGQRDQLPPAPAPAQAQQPVPQQPTQALNVPAANLRPLQEQQQQQQQRQQQLPQLQQGPGARPNMAWNRAVAPGRAAGAGSSSAAAAAFAWPNGAGRDAMAALARGIVLTPAAISARSYAGSVLPRDVVEASVVQAAGRIPAQAHVAAPAAAAAATASEAAVPALGDRTGSAQGAAVQRIMSAPVARGGDAVAAAVNSSSRPWLPLRGRLEEALHAACDANQLEVVKFLHKSLNLTTNQARSRNNFAVRTSVVHGQLDIVRYLLDELGLTTEDLRSNNNFALRIACDAGRLDFVKLLLDGGRRLTVDDLRANDNEAFCAACVKGHVDVVRYIVGLNILKREDLLCRNMYVMRSACWRGSLEILELLMQAGLNDEDLAHEGFAVLMAARCNHKHVLRWLLVERRVPVPHHMLPVVQRLVPRDAQHLLHNAVVV